MFEADVRDRVVAIAMAEGLFDRFFRVITIIGNPLIAAALAGIMLLFF